MSNPYPARTMAVASGLLLAVLIGPRVARACALPSDCTQLAPVCELGVCHGCLTNYTDGGLNDPLFACQDPSLPVCDLEDGGLGGQCVAAPADAGATDAGQESDAGDKDASAPDGGHEEADAGDASAQDAGHEEADASDASASDGSTETDGAVSADDSGASEDGSASDGSVDATSSPDGAASSEDASTGGDGGGRANDAGAVDDDSYVEGGGCSCDAVRDHASLGGALVGLAAILTLGARRRRSR